MYTPAHFSMPDGVALRVAGERGFGTLVVATAEGFEASPMPFVVDDTDDVVIRAHVARANPIVAALTSGAAVLLLVDVADGYISPTWYPSKQEHHKVVPTWNYVAVHVHGNARVVHDRDWLLDVVTRLTDRHEASLPKPWSVADAPAEHVDAMLRAIVGIEITVGRVQGKAKLSQNRSTTDARSAAVALRSAGRVELANMMDTAIAAGTSERGAT